MKYPTFLFLIVFVFFSINLPAQEFKISHPMKIPVAFSGSFAELRSNHLHAGVDFRTGGVTGQEIHAVADGFVYRIGVSPTGYGNVLYIEHPEGFQTVYGHMKSFRKDIEQWVKQQQYQQESFSVDLQLESVQFPVKRGDLIGYSGNTGSSGGPHLHFEVRDKETEDPLNPLLYGINFIDNTAPTIRAIKIYNFEQANQSKDKANISTYTASRSSGNRFIINGNQTIKTTSNIGISIHATDTSVGSTANNGPYKYEMRIDSTLVFTQTMDRFSFDETKAANSIADYQELLHNRTYNSLWVEPNNLLNIYSNLINDGFISLTDTNKHRVSITVYDLKKNKASIDFYIQNQTVKTPIDRLNENIKIFNPNKVYWNSKFVYRDPSLELEMNRGSVYQSFEFKHEEIRLNNMKYPVHIIGNEDIPLHKAVNIRMRAQISSNIDPTKLILAKVSLGGGLSNAGGKWNRGWMEGTISRWGSYTITTDTIAPTINNLIISTKTQTIQCRIHDNLSGIASYRGEIDGQWILMEYDAKKASLIYNFDSNRLKRNNTTKHFKLVVTDAVGNSKTINSNFTW